MQTYSVSGPVMLPLTSQAYLQHHQVNLATNSDFLSPIFGPNIQDKIRISFSIMLS